MFDIGDSIQLESLLDDGIIMGRILDIHDSYYIADTEKLGKIRISVRVGQYYSQKHNMSLKICDPASFNNSLEDNDPPVPFLGSLEYIKNNMRRKITDSLYAFEEELLIIYYKTHQYDDFERRNHHLVHIRNEHYEYVPHAHYVVKKAGLVKSAMKR